MAVKMTSRMIMPNPLGNERGMIIFDFIFALVVSFSIAIVFCTLTATLSLVEMAQYVTYTTSRAYFGAHDSKTLQEGLGQQRFAEVMAKPAFKTFLGSTWMTLGQPQLSDFSDEYPDPANASNRVFIGARVTMNAKLLHMNVPFLGATAQDSNVGKATLNSYLMREVTTQECREGFTRNRYQNLINSSPEYGSASGTEKLITDNGC